MQDRFQRKIDYLRISVTDRCNLRCRYCMPAGGVPPLNHDNILELEEIFRVASAAADLGFRKIRLTGGEALVRKGLVNLVNKITSIAGIEEVSLTTNGLLLPQYAGQLKEAGLNRVNISLDTLDEKKYFHITRRPAFNDAWAGIEAAVRAGLEPVKINVVVIKGFNDDEILDFVRLAVEQPLHVRFIELMPIGKAFGKGYLPLDQVEQSIGRHYPLRPDQEIPGGGPARNYTLPGGRGSIGFISAITRHFCHQCNRLRLTADGKLRPCLQKGMEIDLKTALRQGAGSTVLQRIIQQAAAVKPCGHNMSEDSQGIEARNMVQIGG